MRSVLEFARYLTLERYVQIISGSTDSLPNSEAMATRESEYKRYFEVRIQSLRNGAIVCETNFRGSSEKVPGTGIVGASGYEFQDQNVRYKWMI